MIPSLQLSPAMMIPPLEFEDFVMSGGCFTSNESRL